MEVAMTDLLALAKIRRAALLDQVSELDAFIRTAEKLQADARRTAVSDVADAMHRAGLAPTVMGNAVTHADVTRNNALYTDPKPAIPVKKQVLEVARELVSKGPINSRGILNVLNKRGIVVGGQDPAGAVAAILSRSEEFISDRDAGGWVFAKTDTPADMSQ
jgi:hypothetical protein